MKFQDLPSMYAVIHSLKVNKFLTMGVAGFTL